MKTKEVVHTMAKALVAVRNLETLLEFTKTRVALRQEVTEEELEVLGYSRNLAEKSTSTAISAIRDVEVE